MNPIVKAKNQLLHGIAKVDARESILRQAPLRRIGLPLAGAGLGVAVSLFDYQQAPNAQLKQKALIRDGLVLSGVTAASMWASYLVNRTRTAKRVLHLLEDALKKLFGRSETFKLTAQHTHHPDDPLPGQALERLKLIFKGDLHDHGTEGAVNLSLLSAIPIFLGGIPAGIVADALNGERIQRTAPMKLKEGLFQFVGNITVCTVAIVGFSRLGKAAVSKLWQAPTVQKKMVQQTTVYLQRLAKRQDHDLGLIPTPLTADVARIVHEHQDYPKQLAKVLGHHLSQGELTPGKRWTRHYQEGLERLIQQGPFNPQAIHDYIRKVFGPAMKSYARQIAKQPEGLKALAQLRYEARGETLGVITGLGAGVVGGAWLSNQLNDGLSKRFHWPRQHESAGLFQRRYRQPAQGQQGQSEPGKGWLSGQVGERGIHWYDGILHLDDVPSALYLGGVRAVESMIQLLYGISAFLAGTAGTDYRKLILRPGRKTAVFNGSPLFLNPPPSYGNPSIIRPFSLPGYSFSPAFPVRMPDLPYGRPSAGFSYPFSSPAQQPGWQRERAFNGCLVPDSFMIRAHPPAVGRPFSFL